MSVFGFIFVLEKLYIDDGKFIHEYISHSLPEAPRLSAALPCLPETNTEEYVRNWCSTHTSQQNDTKTSESLYHTAASDDCDSIGSSLQESLEVYPKVLNFDNVTMRGNKICQREQGNINLTLPCRKLSRESGILTLPDSSSCVSEFDEPDIQQNSDYFTESLNSPSLEDNNVSKISNNTLRVNDLNDAKIGESLLTSNNNTSSELSFVTVSEWLRYTDNNESITLFEKRLLNSFTR